MFPPPVTPTRVTHYNRGYGYGVVGVTGTMAAALAADSLVFAMLNGLQASAATSNQLRIYLERLRLAFTTIGAFTTVIDAGRRLAVYRATGGVAATGGTALTVIPRDSTSQSSAIADARIATTAALTNPSADIVLNGAPIAQMDLTAFGAAGGRQEWTFDLAAPAGHEIVLQPGELIVVVNPQAMDAAGTWQLAINELAWTEATGTER